MSSLSKLIASVEEVYDIQDIFEGIEEGTSDEEIRESAIPALERAFEFDCENEEWAFVGASIAGALIEIESIELAGEVIERSLNMVVNQPDETQALAMLNLCDLSMRPKEDGGLDKVGLVAPYVQELMRCSPDDSFTLREIGNLIAHYNLADVPAQVAIAKRLEALELEIDELCELAQNVHGYPDDAGSWWNLGDKEWAVAVLARASNQASSKSEEKEIAATKSRLKLD